MIFDAKIILYFRTHKALQNFLLLYNIQKRIVLFLLKLISITQSIKDSTMKDAITFKFRRVNVFFY